MDYTWHYPSPLGGMTLASDGSSLIGLWFDDQRYFAETLETEFCAKSLPVFADAVRWLDVYFSGKSPDFVPALSMRTTPFRREVWKILMSIPFGQTMTYGEIAKLLAEQRGLSQMSAQAVGGAVAHNAISLIIPCHRVIGTDGTLTGYAGGLDRKVKLLEMERTGRQIL